MKMNNIYKVCTFCGCDLPLKYYYNTCETCREKIRYDKCTKMTIEKYKEDFKGNLVILPFNDDTYFSSVEEALNYCRVNRRDIPHYVYGTEKYMQK